jgi:hypothetical protein
MAMEGDPDGRGGDQTNRIAGKKHGARVGYYRRIGTEAAFQSFRGMDDIGCT